MGPLTTISYLTCSELEEEIHHAEMEQLQLAIMNLPDYSCEFYLTFVDDYHKMMNFPLEYESHLHQVFNFIDEQDIKNGVDPFLTDEGDLVFRTYGQGYTYQGKEGMLTAQILVKVFDDKGQALDMSEALTDMTKDHLTPQKEEMTCDSI